MFDFVVVDNRHVNYTTSLYNTLKYITATKQLHGGIYSVFTSGL